MGTSLFYYCASKILFSIFKIKGHCQDLEDTVKEIINNVSRMLCINFLLNMETFEVNQIFKKIFRIQMVIVSDKLFIYLETKIPSNLYIFL